MAHAFLVDCSIWHRCERQDCQKQVRSRLDLVAVHFFAALSCYPRSVWTRALGVSKTIALRVFQYGFLGVVILLSIWVVLAILNDAMSISSEPEMDGFGNDGGNYSTSEGNLLFLFVVIGTVVALVRYEKKKKLKASQKTEDQ